MWRSFIIISFMLCFGFNGGVGSHESCENLTDTVGYDNCQVKLMNNNTNFEILCHTNRTYSNKRWEDARQILMTFKFQASASNISSTTQNVSHLCIRLLSLKVQGLPVNKLDNRILRKEIQDIDIERAIRPRLYGEEGATYVDYSQVKSFQFDFYSLSNSSEGFMRYNESCILDVMAKNNLLKNDALFTKCVARVEALQFNSHPTKIFSFHERHVTTYAAHIFDFTNFALVRGRLNPVLHGFALQLFKPLSDKVGFPLLSELKIRELSLAFNNIEKISDVINHDLPSLKILDLNNSNIEFITNKDFISTPNVEHLNLAGNYLLFNLTEVGLPNLKTLILPGCPKISRNIFFYNYPNLHTLDLSDNNLRNELDLSTVFQHFPNLRNLILDKNNIEQLLDFFPPINNNSNQNYFVSLRENNIESWNETKLNLSKHSSLRLDLSANSIAIVTPQMLEDFSSVAKVILDNNPFECRQCVVDSFVNWLIKHDSDADYRCLYPEEAKNKRLLDLKLDPEFCGEQIFNWLNNFYIPLIIFAIVIIVFTVLIIKYKWQMRYFYHLFRARMMTKRRDATNEGDLSHLYDAFVSYCSMESNWVVEQLIPHVEREEPALHLCVHERDFVIGDTIINNIIECIDVSRKSIFLITNKFIKSNWCQWELQMAQHKLFDEGSDVLILILLEELDPGAVPKTLKRLMSTRTYLIWPDPRNVPACKLFWSRLKQTIGQCNCKQSQNQMS